MFVIQSIKNYINARKLQKDEDKAFEFFMKDYILIYQNQYTKRDINFLKQAWKDVTKEVEIYAAKRLFYNYRKRKFRKNSKKLIPVYYSPSYRGGILAKKDLKQFITNLKPV